MSKISPILECSVQSIGKKANSMKKNLVNSVKQCKLEKQSVVDLLDLSLEEYGKFRIGNRIVNIIFPR